MMFEPYRLPDVLNPDYMRGYVDGYEAMRKDVLDEINTMRAVTETTSTTTTDSQDGLKGEYDIRA